MRAKFVLNEGFGQKDLVRMQDIKTKSAGNHEKELSLARTQANIIQDPGKAQARAEAAVEVFGPGSEIFQIFHDRAVELGGSSVRSKASTAVLAPVTGPVGKGEKIERKFKTQYILPSERVGAAAPEQKGGGGFQRGNSEIFKNLGIGRFSSSSEAAPEIGGGRQKTGFIGSLGRVHLGTGECDYFNVFTTYSGTAEVWKNENGNPRLVFTSGDKPLAKLKDYREFRNDQTQQRMGQWTMIDYVPVAELKELIRVYGASLPGYTYK